MPFLFSMAEKTDCISLLINIVGWAIFKSSGALFQPVLCMAMVESIQSYILVIVTAVFWGLQATITWFYAFLLGFFID